MTTDRQRIKEIDFEINNKKSLDLSIEKQNSFRIKDNKKFTRDIGSATINATIMDWEKEPFPKNIEKEVGLKSKYFNNRICKANRAAAMIMQKQDEELKERKIANLALQYKIEQQQKRIEKMQDRENKSVVTDMKRNQILTEGRRIFKDKPEVIKLLDILDNGGWNDNAKMRKTRYKILDTLSEYQMTTDRQRIKE